MRWPLDPQPVVVDRGVALEPYRTDRAADLFAALDDPRVWEHVPGDVPTTPAELDTRFRAGLADGSRATWVIVDDGRVVGTTSAIHDPDRPDGIEIGATYLAVDTWRTGLNGRVKERLVAALFDAGAAWIQLRTDERNARSAAAIAKLGAVDLGVRPDRWIRRDGTRRSSRFFRLDRPEGR